MKTQIYSRFLKSFTPVSLLEVVGGQHSNYKEVTQWNLSYFTTKQTIYNFIVGGQKRRKLPVIMSSSKQEMSSVGLILK